MKTLSKSLVVACVASSLSVTAQAAVVTWGTPTNIIDDTDVSTTGTLERAEYLTPNTPTTTTVNVVTFQSLLFNGAFGDITGTTVTLGDTVISTSKSSIDTAHLLFHSRLRRQAAEFSEFRLF